METIETLNFAIMYIDVNVFLVFQIDLHHGVNCDSLKNNNYLLLHVRMYNFGIR